MGDRILKDKKNLAERLWRAAITCIMEAIPIDGVKETACGGESFMKRCPCCGCSTIDDTDEVSADICEVCFWQYDEVAQNMPDRIIGPNKVSLNTAKKNYKLFGAIEECFINMVRPPYEDEI